MIHGNTQGIRDSVLQEMEALYDADMELLRHTLVSQPLMEELARLTSGERITGATLEAAGELLDSAERFKRALTQQK